MLWPALFKAFENAYCDQSDTDHSCKLNNDWADGSNIEWSAVASVLHFIIPYTHVHIQVISLITALEEGAAAVIEGYDLVLFCRHTLPQILNAIFKQPCCSPYLCENIP